MSLSQHQSELGLGLGLRLGLGSGLGLGFRLANPNPNASPSPSPNPNQVATLIETLRVRLLRRQARLDQGGAGEAAAAAPGCALTPARDEIAEEDGKPAPGFEGRTVNGWVI